MELTMSVLCLALFFGLGSAAADTVCSKGWMANEGQCYLFGTQAVHFTSAEGFCRSHNAHLVEVVNTHENDFIKDRMRDLKARNWWVGITDEASEGEWKLFSSDRLIQFNDWHPGQPDNKNEDCAVYVSSYNFQWADISCIGTATPVCKKSSSRCRPDIVATVASG